jgi:hypothetical protein
MKLYMFQTIRLSIIRSLFTVHSAVVYVIQALYTQLSTRSICSCSKALYKPVRHIPFLSVQWINSWWWTDELSETCRVSWQNKFVKLVHLFDFITKKFVTMHGHMNAKFWLCVGEMSVSKFTGTQGITLLGTGNHRNSTKIRPPLLSSKPPPIYHSMNRPIIKRQISYRFFMIWKENTSPTLRRLSYCPNIKTSVLLS